MRTKLLLVAALGILGSTAAQAQAPGQNCQPGQPCKQGAAPQANNAEQGKNKPNQQTSAKGNNGMQKGHSGQQQSNMKPGHQQTAQGGQSHGKPQGRYKVTADMLNVRGEPGNGAPVHGHFRHGQQIEVYSIVDGWAKVLLDGHFRWISSKYIIEIN
ncbi:SH3 domain-containing protein [Vibrio viridaestus]|uniref:SH3 domain-containing protein n=1 Tax=Vibrio viridaestus TaxID=2487322 RepID=A0A3N9TEI2_9VIBR|nr:SH3 domain-containing protein [Vibrio viridaestus]RQW62113.1 SH3 domain-containing protein [Vibrio viridaestus]